MLRHRTLSRNALLIRRAVLPQSPIGALPIARVKFSTSTTSVPSTSASSPPIPIPSSSSSTQHLNSATRTDFIPGYRLSTLLEDPSLIQDALELFFDIHHRGQVNSLSKETCLRLIATLCEYDLPEALKTVLGIVKTNLPTYTSILADIAKLYARTQTIDDGTIDSLWEDGYLGRKRSEQDRIAMASIRGARGDLAAVLNLFKGRPHPGTPSRQVRRYRVILRAAITARALPSAQHYLAMITKIRADHRAVNSVLQLAVDMDEPHRAQQIFTKFEEAGYTHDLMAHTTMIGFYARRGELALAESLFESMVTKGIEPDATAWAALLNAYIEAGDWEGLGERYQEMPENYRGNHDVISTVMKALVLRKTPLSQVLELFRTLEHPTAHHWSFVIQSASDHGDLRVMETLFREMETLSRTSPTAFKPNVYVYSILLHAYLKANEAEQSRATYDEMLRIGIIPTSVTYSMIITSYANGTAEDSLQRAQEFAMSIHRLSSQSEDGQAPLPIDKGKRRRANAVENLFSPLVVAAGRAGQTQQAAENFEMIAKSTEPSIPMYSRYLDVWRKAHEPGMVMRIWAEVFALACRIVSVKPAPPSHKSRRSKTKSTSNLETETESSSPLIEQRQPDNALAIPLTIVLITLGRDKRLLDIRRVWDEVRGAGFGFDASNFNQLAISLAQAGDVEGAFDIVENVLLDPTVTSQATGLENVTAIPASFGLKDRIPNATDPAFKPPNRRSESASMSAQDEASTLSIADHLSAPLVDSTWRPNFRTLLTLDTVVSQLESSSDNRAWMGLAMTEEGEDDVDGEFYGTTNGNDNSTGGEGGEGDVEGGLVALPSFGTYVRDSKDGQPKRTSARGLLMKLNRKYSKAMALVMFHRKKMSDKRRNNMGTGSGRRGRPKAGD